MIDLLLFFAAMAAGALNSVAGGGTFIAFPALIFAGVSPVAANATCTIAVWPGAVSSAFAYRKELGAQPKLPKMLALSLIGGAAGALVLLSTPARTFEFLIPWLMLAATLLFTFSPRITRYAAILSSRNHSTEQGEARSGGVWGKTPTHEVHMIPFWVSAMIQLGIAFYGGYFGAGIGILMLAMLSMLGMTHIHEMNALKTLLGSAINGVAVMVFLFSGMVVWRYGVVMIAGAMLGGYFGAHYARTLPKEKVRNIVTLTASCMTAYFFVKAWG